MKIGIVTDSCCDLPRSFLDKYNITILPITIKCDNISYTDDRHHDNFNEVLQNIARNNCESIPLSKEQITELFLKKLAIEFDYVICITVSSTRSMIYENLKEASFSIISGYKSIRERLGLNNSFSLRLIDSQQLFCGQAVIVAELIRQLKKGVSPEQAMQGIHEIIGYTQTFLLPFDLSQMRNQARKKGDKSVSMLSYLLGSTLDIKPIIRAYKGETKSVSKVKGFDQGTEKIFNFVVKQIKNGLKCPHICISFGGNPEEIKNFKGFKKLLKTASQYKINIIISEMSATAIVNIGLNGLCIGFASEKIEDI